MGSSDAPAAEGGISAAGEGRAPAGERGISAAGEGRGGATVLADGGATVLADGGAPPPPRSSIDRAAVALTWLALVGVSAGAGIGAVAARALEREPLGAAAAGAALGAAACAALGRRRLAAQLPDALDGWLARRRVRGAAWLLVAALAVANTARLGLFVADPTQTWASALPPVAAAVRHQCFAAYVRAGELAAAGEDDLWRPAAYARPAPAAPSPTAIRGLAAYLLDPYEYPPPFAALCRAAVAAAPDYHLLRAAWFALSAAGLGLAYLSVALWAGGRAGATALLLWPALALAFPVTLGLQAGQAHLLVVAAAAAAMVQLARGRRLAGAALLAAATATKVFPGLLLVHLAVRRRWRDLAATLVALAALALLAALVLGAGPLRAFVTEQLPRMSSGEAFANTWDNPDNHAPYALPFKLAALGALPASAAPQLGAALAWAWGAVALVLAALASRGRPPPARDAVIWLAVLCLGTLRSPFAPMYSAVGTLWLLALWLGAARPTRRAAWAAAAAWALLQGAPPFFSERVNVLASLPAQAATIAIAVAAAWPRRARAP